MTAAGDLEQDLADGLKKPYSMADARRIAEALNMRWGRFGVEQFKLVLNEENDKSGPAEPEEGPDRVEGVI